MPLGAPEEDALVYCSDPFLRRMVDARTRLVERRRAIGLSHLRLIGHAAELYATQFGKRPASLHDIEKAGLAPVFNAGAFASPFGGAYSLAPDGLVGVCSILGTADFLTPLAELPHSDATPLEAKLYRDFVKENAERWKTRFDPTIVRIAVTPEKLRLETVMLSPTDDSTYAAIAEYLGGPPVRLDALPVPSKNLFTLNLHFNKAKILQELKKLDKERAGAETRRIDQMKLFARLGIESRTEHFISTDVPKGVPELTDKSDKTEAERVLERLQRRSIDLFARGLDGQIGLHFYDQRIMFDLDFQRFVGDLTRIRDRSGSKTGGVVVNQAEPGLAGMLTGFPMGFLAGSFVSPMPLKRPASADPKVVDEFFEEYDALVRKYGHLLQSRESGIVVSADPHVVVTKAGHRVRSFQPPRLGPLRWRTYLARIGNGIFLTNQTEVIDDDLHHADETKTPWSRSRPGRARHDPAAARELEPCAPRLSVHLGREPARGDEERPAPPRERCGHGCAAHRMEQHGRRKGREACSEAGRARVTASAIGVRKEAPTRSSPTAPHGEARYAAPSPLRSSARRPPRRARSRG